MNMAPSSSSSSSSSTKSSLSPHPHHSPCFTPIPECEREENEDGESEQGTNVRATPSEKKEVDSKYNATPLHHADERGKNTWRKRPESAVDSGVNDRGVSCNKCRPNNRDKISVVPVGNNDVSRHSIASPNGIFKSILFSLTKKSPRAAEPPGREEQWRIAVAELSHKLIQATRNRDEAVLEASRLKYSVTELERKLNKLEIYCQNLKSGLEICASKSPNRPITTAASVKYHHDKAIEHFLVSVSESRSSIRLLSRSLTLQFRQMGVKVYERLSLLLQPHDFKFSLSKNPTRSLLLYIEALLNKTFYEDFESVGFQKSAPTQILNPIDRCEANLASFDHLRGLTWDEVLNKGTRHYSEEFSRFCDRKMNEIVAMLGWNRAWPEPLLQAFFGASKGVWLVHLLANSVHPGMPVFRVDTGVGFDSVYMEDMGGDRAPKLVPTVVRVMVTPGFYVYGNVVKCKVICRYHNNSGNSNNYESSEKVLAPSPT
ncbi:IRK-interacting protein [Actinidia chinensis var. chinensis]|uniref:IRK-interacting protein n=1 Tax=Actinidia chinensis var. chinensis TaxID=1590841 RepID=A0A2R6QK49_ACTCC|nr:IRK-interacting protein [Actinidia chinensis var. chinensis]